MLALNTLTNNQKLELRNAFKLVDGESRDSIITKQDIINFYESLGKPVPLEEQLKQMLGSNEKGMNFAQFLSIIAEELQIFNSRAALLKALKTFGDEEQSDDGIIIDLEKLKEACCSVQLGDIGSGTSERLSRSVFDKVVHDFVEEQIDGKKIFQASKWIAAYVD